MPVETICTVPVAELVVVDASAVVDLLVRSEATLPSGATLVAPAHLDAEVLSALARLCRADVLSDGAVVDMLEGLAELPLDRVPLPRLLLSAFELRDNVSQRDSLYVALAQQLEAPLLTLDHRLATACRHRNLCAVL